MKYTKELTKHLNDLNYKTFAQNVIHTHTSVQIFLVKEINVNKR